MGISSSITDAVDGLPDAVFLVDDDGVIVAANSAATIMFGFSQSQLIGSQVDELMPENARDYHRKARAGAVADRRPRSFTSGVTFECERRDGERFQADINLSTTTVDGVPMTWAIVRDLDGPAEANTGRRQAMSALDTIGHLATSAFDLEHDFAAVAEGLNKIVPHDRIAVMLIRKDDPEIAEVLFVAGEVHPKYPVGAEVAVKDSAISSAIQSREPVSFSRDQIGNAPAAVQHGLAGGYTETYGVPLFDSDGIFGMMMTATKSQSKFSEFQKNLMVRLGDHLAVAVVNSLLLKRTLRESEIESTLVEIGKLAGSTFDLQSTENELGPLIRSLVDNRSTIIAGVTEDQTHLRIFYIGNEGVEPEVGLTPDLRLNSLHPIKGTTTETVLQTRKSILVNAASGEDFVKQYPGAGSSHLAGGLRSSINVPLVANNQVYGVLNFRTDSSAGYSDADLELSGKIADQLASSVALIESHRRDAELAIERSALISVGNILGSAHDLNAVWDEFATVVSTLVPFSHIGLVGINRTDGVVRYLQEYLTGELDPFSRERGTYFSIDGTVTEELISRREGFTQSFAELSDWREYYPNSHPQIDDVPIKSMIAVPLIWGDEVVAGLYIHNTEFDAYDQSDLEIVERIAVQIAGPVAGSLLRDQEANLATKREVLVRIGALLGAAINLESVWGEFGVLLAEIIDFDRCVVVALDHEAEKATVLHDTVDPEDENREEGLRTTGETYDLPGTVAEHLANYGRSIIVNQDKPNQLIEQFKGVDVQGFKLPFL